MVSRGMRDPLHIAREVGPIETTNPRTWLQKVVARSREDRSEALIARLRTSATVIEMRTWNIGVDARVNLRGWYAQPVNAKFLTSWAKKGRDPSWVDGQLVNFVGIPYRCVSYPYL